MIRTIPTVLLLLAVLSPAAHAKGNQVEFSQVQKECVRVGPITYGPGGRWASCRVTRGRWVATMDFMDLYQAQYCLGKKEKCDQRALVIFSNRAYKPSAKALLVRVDSGDTEYDDPVVVSGPKGRFMVVTAHSPTGADAKSYYRWHNEQWVPVAGIVAKELAAHFPDKLTMINPSPRTPPLPTTGGSSPTGG